MHSIAPRIIGHTAAPSASAHLVPQHLTPAFEGTQARSNLLRMPEVQARTGLGKSMIYALIAKRQFPASVKCGPRVVAWIDAEVDAWVSARIAESKGRAA